MAHRHPFRGFPSKNAYIRDCLSKGMTAQQIIKESGITPNHVHVTINSYNQESFRHMWKAARRRGLTLAQLKRELMLVIEKHKMVDAILDDEDEYS